MLAKEIVGEPASCKLRFFQKLVSVVCPAAQVAAQPLQALQPFSGLAFGQAHHPNQAFPTPGFLLWLLFFFFAA